MKKITIALIAGALLAASPSLNDLRHTPEGQIIRQAVRMGDDTQMEALKLAVASHFAWGREALELSVKSGGPAQSLDPDHAIYTNLVVHATDVSVENCRHYLSLMVRLTKADADNLMAEHLNFGAVRVISHADNAEAAKALESFADSDELAAKSHGLSSLAYSALVEMRDEVAVPALSDLAAHGHSAVAHQWASNALANRARSQEQLRQLRQHSGAPVHVDPVYETMKNRSAAELASFVTSSDQHEAESAIKVLASQASQRPLEVRPALERGLTSSLPVMKVQAAAALLDMDSQ